MKQYLQSTDFQEYMKDNISKFFRHIEVQGLDRQDFKYREESVELLVQSYFNQLNLAIEPWRFQTNLSYRLNLENPIEKQVSELLRHKGKQGKFNSDLVILSEVAQGQKSVDLVLEIKSNLRTQKTYESLIEDLLLVYLYQSSFAKQAGLLVVNHSVLNLQKFKDKWQITIAESPLRDQSGLSWQEISKSIIWID